MTAILGIATAVPATAVSQRAVRDLFAAQPGISRLTARLIRAAFDRSAIDIRHTVLTDFDGVPSGFINLETSAFERPTTAKRNAIYVEQAPKLFAQAARGALQAAGVVADGSGGRRRDELQRSGWSLVVAVRQGAYRSPAEEAQKGIYRTRKH